MRVMVGSKVKMYIPVEAHVHNQTRIRNAFAWLMLRLT